MIKLYYRWRARRGLINKYNLDIAVEEILKSWITECIIKRNQSARRPELVESQNKLDEQKLFLKWLKARKL